MSFHVWGRSGFARVLRIGVSFPHLSLKKVARCAEYSVGGGWSDVAHEVDDRSMGVGGDGDPSLDPVLVREPHDGDGRGTLSGPMRHYLLHLQGGGD
jgi:hypothetical protein